MATDDDIVTMPDTWPLPPTQPAAADSQGPGQVASLQTFRGARHAEVIRLHKAGAAVPEIARKLQLEAAQVELVLNLHKSRVQPLASPTAPGTSVTASRPPDSPHKNNNVRLLGL